MWERQNVCTLLTVCRKTFAWAVQHSFYTEAEFYEEILQWNVNKSVSRLYINIRWSSTTFGLLLALLVWTSNMIFTQFGCLFLLFNKRKISLFLGIIFRVLFTYSYDRNAVWILVRNCGCIPLETDIGPAGLAAGGDGSYSKFIKKKDMSGRKQSI